MPKEAKNQMKLEDSINLMVIETASKTTSLDERMKELIFILNSIHKPLASAPTQRVITEFGTYDFDDLLILLFELVQLMETFQRFAEAKTSLEDFLLFHSSRLVKLCLDQRLNYISDIVEFKKAIVGDAERQ